MIAKSLLVTFLAIFVFTVSALADSTYRVLAAPARYHVVVENIHDVCGSDTMGCTRLSGVSFVGTCERDGAQWRLRADVSFVPFVYLPPYSGSMSNAIVAHERSHIRDLHRDAVRYVRGVTARRFASSEQCRAAGLVEQVAFHDRMRDFAADSMRVRR
jgi:hypothetical protein